MVSDSETFNEYQRRRLRVTCQHIDGLLTEIETILGASDSKPPFPKYVTDLGAAQRKRLEHGLARMRAQLLQVLGRNGIEVAPPSISAAHAIHSALTFAQIAVEELAPKRMRGYGEVSRRAASELEHIVSGLLEQLSEMDADVNNGAGSP